MFLLLWNSPCSLKVSLHPIAVTINVHIDSFQQKQTVYNHKLQTSSAFWFVTVETSFVFNLRDLAVNACPPTPQSRPQCHRRMTHSRQTFTSFRLFCLRSFLWKISLENGIRRATSIGSGIHTKISFEILKSPGRK